MINKIKNNKIKAASVIVSIIIIVMNLIKFGSGLSPSWSTFFVGWILLFWSEIEDFYKAD